MNQQALVRHFISFPKSGRSWIRYALTLLDLESSIVFHHDDFEFNDGTKPPHDFSLVRRLQRYAGVDRLVYLERDPRDIMVSLYFQVTGRFSDFFHYNQGISAFIRDEYFGAKNLKKFRDLWTEMGRQKKILVVSYEDCHRDMAQILGKILAYYEFSVDSSSLLEAVAKADFSNMKQVELSGAFPHAWLKLRRSSFKVREGRVGSFRDQLNDEDVRYLNRVFSMSE